MNITRLKIPLPLMLRKAGVRLVRSLDSTTYQVQPK